MVAVAPPAPGATPAWGVWGLDGAVEHLRRALRQDRLGHAYLVTGPAGVGKRTLAERLAAAVSCAAEDVEARPCLECRACRRIAAGEATDVEVVAPGGLCDAAGHDHARDASQRIRICQVRRLERMANLAPFAAPMRVFIVRGADRLQAEAAHALLKTLEEPPATSLLVLTAVDAAALLDTVRSRCQEIPLRPMTRADLRGALVAAGVPAAEAEALAAGGGGRFGVAHARYADPGAALLRETARSDMQQLAAASRNERFDHVAAVARRWTRERDGVVETIAAWREWWRDVLLATAAVGEQDGGALGTPRDPALLAAAAACSPPVALGALDALERLRAHLGAGVQPQLALEVAMLDLPTLGDLSPAAGAPGTAEDTDGTTHPRDARPAAARPDDGNG